MIKQVDEIPMNRKGKGVSYRRQITADIQQAIDSGITKFEFDGDYNWKYLAQYAREEAKTVLQNALTKAWAEVRKPNDKGYIPDRPHYYERHIRDIQYIKIHNVKQTDRNHVYCEIIPEAIDEMIAAHEKYLIEAEKRHAEYEAKRAERREQRNREHTMKKTDVHNLVKVKEAANE